MRENRNGLAVDGGITQAAAPPNVRPRLRCSIALGADKAYEVQDLRERTATPHIATDGHLSKTGKRHATAMDRRTTRHPGYAISQCCHQRIEEVFGRVTGSARLAKIKLRGRAEVDAVFTLALVPYNLVRLPKLPGAPA